jgi:UDP-N-acetylglucosamine acyltransferase
MTTSFIHPSAIVENGAELGDGVYIGPFCIVGSHVKLGRGTKLHSHVVITGHTTLGEENEIYPFASIGHAPQDLKYKGEPTLLKLGNKNIIREYATLQPGTVTGCGETVVGNSNLFMAHTHVAHDCIVGNENVFANCASLAGHVTVCDQTVLGGLAAIHQFCVIGDMAMVGLSSVVVHDVPPYAIAEGNRANIRGLNVVAMKRRGLLASNLANVRKAYKILFLSGFPTVAEARVAIEKEGILTDPCVQKFVEAIETSKRGVVRPSAEALAGAREDSSV